MRNIIFLLFLCFPFYAVAQKKNVKSEEAKSEFGFMHDWGDSVTAEGVWRADNLTEENELPDSVTHLECYKTGGQQLVDSNAYCMEASAQILIGMPSIEVRYFPVTRWDKDMIVAADSPSTRFPICIWTQITISLREKSIMATDTRKLGKGHEGFMNACEKTPLAQTYHLMDQVKETVRREMRKSKQPQSK
jgi:hypothetical protein